MGPLGGIRGAGFLKGFPGAGAIGDYLGTKGGKTLMLAGAGTLLGGLGQKVEEGDTEAIAATRDVGALRSYLFSGYKNLGYTDDQAQELTNKDVAEYTSGQGGYATGGRVGYAMGTPEDKAIQASGIMGIPLNENAAGVTELDLRNNGGFIPPVGIKEKADDIPAMLSNNEFVFTADAVRGMGDGNVNKGAQRMYDMMKALEKKSSIMAETITQIQQPPAFIEAAGKTYLTDLQQAVGGFKQADLSQTMGPQFVAGAAPLQQQAIAQASGLGAYQPYLTTASGLTGPTAYQDYMSPYQRDVIGTTLQEYDIQAQKGLGSIADRAYQAGAFGGARQGVAEAEYQALSDRNRAALQVQLLQQGYTQAQQAAQQDYTRQMQLAQAAPALASSQIAGLTTLGGLQQAQTQEN